MKKLIFLTIAVSAFMNACATTLPRTGAEELELVVGPVDLSAASEGSHGEHQHEELPSSAMHFKFPEDGWITRFEPSLVSGDKVVPGEALHHVVVGDHDHKSPTCDTSESGHNFNFLFASGGEQTQIKFPRGYGVPVDAETTYTAGGVFSPTTERSYKDVQFKASIGFTARSSGKVLKPLLPVWIDVVHTCPEDGYIINSNDTNKKVRDFRFPFNGKIVFGAGHLHKYGIKLKVYNKKTGETIFEFKPEKTAEETTKINPVFFEDGIKINTDTVYTIEAEYTNPTPYPISAMGIALVFVSPENYRSASSLYEVHTAELLDPGIERVSRPVGGSKESPSSSPQKDTSPREPQQGNHQGHDH